MRWTMTKSTSSFQFRAWKAGVKLPTTSLPLPIVPPSTKQHQHNPSPSVILCLQAFSLQVQVMVLFSFLPGWVATKGQVQFDRGAGKFGEVGLQVSSRPNESVQLRTSTTAFPVLHYLCTARRICRSLFLVGEEDL